MHLVAPVCFASKLFFEVFDRGMFGVSLPPHLQTRFCHRAIVFCQIQFEMCASANIANSDATLLGGDFSPAK
jgi:hypothetical protein